MWISAHYAKTNKHFLHTSWCYGLRSLICNLLHLEPWAFCEVYWFKQGVSLFGPKDMSHSWMLNDAALSRDSLLALAYAGFPCILLLGEHYQIHRS